MDDTLENTLSLITTGCARLARLGCGLYSIGRYGWYVETPYGWKTVTRPMALHALAHDIVVSQYRERDCTRLDTDFYS